MSNNLAGVLNLLLAQPHLELELQRRILAHGTDIRDHHLLARLAGHPSLHDDVDALLGAVNSAVVRIAWVSRKGRTVEQIADMVRSEKRVTVLMALVEAEGLPDELFRTIVDRTDSAKLLHAVMRSSCDIRIRKDAGHKLIELAPVAHFDNDTLDHDRFNSVTAVINSLPELTEELMDSNDLYVLFAMANRVTLPPEVQTRLVTMYRDRYSSRLEEVQQYRNYNNPGQLLVDLVASLSENGPIGEDVAMILDSMLEKYRERSSQSWMHSRIDSARQSLGRCTPEGVEEFRLRFAAIDTPEAMTSFITELESSRNAGSLSIPDGLMRKCAIEVISSPYASLEDVSTVCDWFSWGDDIASAVKAAGETDVERIATVINSLHYVNVDEALDSVAEPDKVMRQLIEQTISTTRGTRHGLFSLTSSKHFKSDHVRLLPLRLLVQNPIDEAHAQAVHEALNEVFTDETAWNSFRTLSEEFEGPLQDLIQVCRSL